MRNPPSVSEGSNRSPVSVIYQASSIPQEMGNEGSLWGGAPFSPGRDETASQPELPPPDEPVLLG